MKSLNEHQERQEDCRFEQYQRRWSHHNWNSEQMMKKEKHSSSIIPFQNFLQDRKIRREWDEIFSMTYDGLIEVLEEMKIKEDAEKLEQQEQEKRNGIPTTTLWRNLLATSPPSFSGTAW
jgi:hypothetical protein